ncbi:efflux transporter outer membrane subunit [Terrarubrum flagellatum]|uniref:efflux transporter outer membrane subunit n=1 Tax=Terrirubrum flagellatum TaxID=2895980 RepID=UPI0031451456
MRIGLTTAFAALALAGCADPSADRSLTFIIPQRYSEPPGRTSEPRLDRWWTRFRSSELNRLVAMAEGGNFDIATAMARLDQADAQARVSGAALFPTVGFSADAQDSRSSGTTQTGFISSPKPRGSLDVGLSASYVLDIWGKLRDSKRAAEMTAQASAFQIDAVRLTTQGSVINAYLQYALALEELRIANDNLRSAERILGVIQQRLSAGTGTALDIAQQESLVANQRASIPPLRQTAANARTTLALLVGRPPQGFEVRAAAFGGLAAPRVAPGIPSALLLRRPDIRAAEASLAAADANLDAARKALLPSIELTGQGGFQSAMLRTLFRPESAFFSIAAGLTQTVFDGGKLQSQVDLSDAQRRELLETYRKSIVSALTDVENALVAIRESDRRDAALRVSVDKARTAFNLSEERLRQGTIDLVTLLNTQQTLFQAQTSLAQSRFSRLQASVSLFQALGGDFADRPQVTRIARNDKAGANGLLNSTAPMAEEPQR